MPSKKSAQSLLRNVDKPEKRDVRARLTRTNQTPHLCVAYARLPRTNQTPHLCVAYMGGSAAHGKGGSLQLCHGCCSRKAKSDEFEKMCAVDSL